ncbi:CPBP family intramembrane glutamic endopeptidase [Enterococcus mundtii]|uniref:CPBP family intramembrane glutamic endopeptidase n=1 Tax=Enterococcus mundtii TaxID=53346 RepID=UPI0039080E54
MISKLKKIAFIKNFTKFLNAFSELILYHSVMFSLVISLITMSETTVTINPYLYSFFFILTINYLLKYLLSCKEIKDLERNNRVPLFVFVLGGYLAIIGLWSIINMLMQSFYGHNDILNQKMVDLRYLDNKALQIPLTVHSIIFAPIVEEIIYRGLLLNAIMFFGLKCNFQKKYLLLAFLSLTSILFGLAHLSDNFLTFVVFALSGLILAVLYLLSGRIIVPITVHFINNLVTSFGMDDRMKLAIIMISLLLIIGLIEYMSPKVKNFYLVRYKNANSQKI